MKDVVGAKTSMQRVSCLFLLCQAWDSQEWVVAATHRPSETNCAAVCMQQATGLGLQVLMCVQLLTSNFALIDVFLYFYCLWSRDNCLPYFIYVVNEKLLVIFQHLQEPGPQQ